MAEGDSADPPVEPSAGGANLDNQEIQEAIRLAVEKQVAPLKANAEALKSEKTEAAAKLAKVLEFVGGEDGLERIKSNREKASKDAMEKLRQEDPEAWFHKRTEEMRRANEASTQELVAAKEASEKAVAETTARLHAEVLKNQVASHSSSVKFRGDGAMSDAMRDVESTFTLRDGTPVVMDGDSVKLNSEGKPYGILDFLIDDRQRNPHRYEGSSGAGATGGVSGLRGTPKSKMSPAEKATFIRENGSEAYNKLPA